MESLPQPKSILDFLAIHQQQTCRRCGGFVDCIRLTADPVYRDGRIWFHPATKSDTCPDCQTKAAADDDERLRLQADFDVMRAMRIALGLGYTQADIRVREGLRIRGQPTTTLWVEEAPTDKPPVVADIYMVLGDGVDLPTEDQASEWISSLSRFPAFSLHFPEPPDFPGVAFVALAANVWHPKRPDVVVQLRWDPLAATRYVMTPVGWERVNSIQRNALVSAASTVFDRWMPDLGGRPLGSTTWKREEFLYELPRVRQKLRTMHDRMPSDTAIAAEMGIPDPTFYRYKKRFLSESE